MFVCLLVGWFVDLVGMFSDAFVCLCVRKSVGGNGPVPMDHQ